MLEARLAQGQLLKKILEAVKELVTDANFDCSSAGISLQGMDSSHVSLVALNLRKDGFEHFRCDQSLTLGVNLESMFKVMRCCGNDDIVTLKAENDGDIITFIFESPSGDKISDFELKLMDIDSEHLGIPDTEYRASVTMPSSEFQRICRDLAVLGETVNIEVNKEEIKFSVQGDIGTGNIVCKQSGSMDSEDKGVSITLQEDVSMAFALRYLNFFARAQSLSTSVTISLSPDVPLCVEFKIGEEGWIRFYLAPKIDEQE